MYQLIPPKSIQDTLQERTGGKDLNLNIIIANSHHVSKTKKSTPPDPTPTHPSSKILPPLISFPFGITKLNKSFTALILPQNLINTGRNHQHPNNGIAVKLSPPGRSTNKSRLQTSTTRQQSHPFLSDSATNTQNIAFKQSFVFSIWGDGTYTFIKGIPTSYWRTMATAHLQNIKWEDHQHSMGHSWSPNGKCTTQKGRTGHVHNNIPLITTYQIVTNGMDNITQRKGSTSTSASKPQNGGWYLTVPKNKAFVPHTHKKKSTSLHRTSWGIFLGRDRPQGTIVPKKRSFMLYPNNLVSQLPNLCTDQPQWIASRLKTKLYQGLSNDILNAVKFLWNPVGLGNT